MVSMCNVMLRQRISCAHMLCMLCSQSPPALPSAGQHGMIQKHSYFNRLLFWDFFFINNQTCIILLAHELVLEKSSGIWNSFEKKYISFGYTDTETQRRHCGYFYNKLSHIKAIKASFLRSVLLPQSTELVSELWKMIEAQRIKLI